MRLAYHPLVQRDVSRILKHYDRISRRLGDEFWSELMELLLQTALRPPFPPVPCLGRLGDALGRLLGRLKHQKSPMFMRFGTAGRLAGRGGPPGRPPPSLRSPSRWAPELPWGLDIAELHPAAHSRSSRLWKNQSIRPAESQTKPL